MKPVVRIKVKQVFLDESVWVELDIVVFFRKVQNCKCSQHLSATTIVQQTQNNLSVKDLKVNMKQALLTKVKHVVQKKAVLVVRIKVKQVVWIKVKLVTQIK